MDAAEEVVEQQDPERDEENGHRRSLVAAPTPP